MDNQGNMVGNGVGAPIGPSMVSPVPEKKKTNIMTLVFGIMALAFAAVAVFFGMKYFEPKKSDNNGSSSGQSDTPAVVTESDMAEEYEEVRKIVEGLIANIESVNNHGINSSSMLYRPDGIDAYVETRLAIVVETAHRVEYEETNEATLKANLEKAGFNSVGVLPMIGSAGPKVYGYSKGDIFCSVNQVATLACAKVGWGWLTEEENELLTELGSAYYGKNDRYPAFDRDSITIKDGYDSYQNLSISGNGGVSLFYRTNDSEEWQYFTVVQAALDCGEFSTDELKKAFYGETCYIDHTTKSTVQL